MALDQFVQACNAAYTYPWSVINSATQKYNLEANYERLTNEETRLFCAETHARIDVSQLRDEQNGPSPTSI